MVALGIYGTYLHCQGVTRSPQYCTALCLLFVTWSNASHHNCPWERHHAEQYQDQGKEVGLYALTVFMENIRI